ncbi:DUF4062 domain-containing protein [Rhodanobacter glycinis]|uniref:DUF4062 domain-containing protein n=1 Tax=Rhodanobacter glycinis TaxID=582702 RepID=UPI00112E5449|nr:DUF4062 domain-containing protein [Rhodanobacter glycinis]TPG48852.1 DUF4062 domain-containing protein [Rhodanobacter glycinis]
MPVTVFLGSTFADLAQHRALVRDAITRLEQNSKAMEFFGALPDTPKDECLRLVRAANAYVGVFGMRYGHVDEASGKSLTQLEYEEAQAVHLPSLIYVMDEETHSVLPKHVDTGDSATNLRELKRQLKERHVVNFFSSPEDLASRVTQDLVRLVGAMAAAPTAQVLSQIAVNSVGRHPLTSARFEFLRSKVAHLFPAQVPDAIFREALELVIGGDRMAASFVLSRGTPMPLDEAIDGLMGFDKVLADILSRHQDNQATSGEV